MRLVMRIRNPPIRLLSTFAQKIIRERSPGKLRRGGHRFNRCHVIELADSNRELRVLQMLFDISEKLLGVRPIDDAMIETEREVGHVTDGDVIFAL